jgi:serine/threonine protein kinase/Tfp pilus assembly protein PilF
MSDSSLERNPVDVLADDFMARQRRGERPSVSEYVARHPELAEEIHEMFPVLLDMEDARLNLVELRGSAGAAGSCPGRLGDYRILREVGRGGMGVVYEAEQESLGRRVALKVLRSAASSPQQIRRFECEARSAGRLHHTNIVPVFGVGHAGDVHYYVMQFIPGQPLDEVQKEVRRLRHSGYSPGRMPAQASEPGSGERPAVADVAVTLLFGIRVLASFQESHSANHVAVPATTLPDPADAVALPLPGKPAGQAQPSGSGSDVLSCSTDLTSSGRLYGRAVARIGVQVADALEYAAEQGVIHRDIKPSNILLDVHGTAWVTDFGLAKVIGQEDLTQTGDLVGTLRYMPPERFRGQADRRGDVYALGLTLYELLALEPAFDESDRAQLIRRVTEEGPRKLIRDDLSIPRDLATIVHKTMAREPADRYATAGALAADLRRFLDDRPIMARRPSLLDRAFKLSRRYRSAVIAGAIGLALALATLAGSLGWIVRDRAARLAMTEREVIQTLGEATAFQGQSKWAEALDAAKRAQGLLAAGAGEPLRRQVDELRQDLEVVLRLEEIGLRGANGAGDDVRRADASYAEAFRAYGIDVDALEPAEAARRIRARSIRLELAVALDCWADQRQGIQARDLTWDGWPDQPDHRPEASDAIWKRLMAVARAADPDVWRDRVRAALEHRDRATLAQLAASPEFSDLPAPMLLVISRHVDSEHMIAALRRAQLEHPDNFSINRHLAWLSRDRGEKIRFFTEAVATRPRHATTTYWLGYHLRRQGMLDEAIAVYRKAIALDPNHLPSYSGLIEALHLQGKRSEADAVIRAAVAARPDNAAIHNDFAWIAATGPDASSRDPRLAVELGSRAVALAPDQGDYWSTLGAARYRAGDWDGAIAALERSIGLRKEGDSYNGFFLAMACRRLGRRDEARAWHDRAVRWMAEHKPNDDELHRFRAEAAELLQIKDPRSAKP